MLRLLSSSSAALRRRTFALPFLHQQTPTHISTNDSNLKFISSHSQRQSLTNAPPPMSDESLILFNRFLPSLKSTESYNSVLARSSSSKRGFTDDDIVGLVTKLGEHGVFPDMFQLMDFISVLCYKRKNCVAWELLRAVKKLGGTVEATSCNVLLRGLGSQNDIRSMYKLLAEMDEMEIRPNVLTFDILIDHLCKARRTDEALGVFDKLRGKAERNWVGVEPHVILYNTLVKGLCKAGREEDC
ncbi:pentatricopeptide repeat-containing protein At3g61520, mitochondrial-like [Medicago truncatula]|uniref:pentatricopeptide repeat-containing protein At3g61520, mitochondrial-like n=1 Tax=Medicago truncatula TaxID=3880 RepID=UPI000D2F39E1|nr:pentatricopeptide repeat-containing protein At3g61520, mitochondrial-like [Medicago truncatula]